MAGMSSPRSDEAASSGQVDIVKAPGAEAASSDDLIGVAQHDVQRQQEVWVKYTTLQEAQVLPEWRQQDSLLAQATAGFGKPHLGHVVQQIDPAHPLSATLKIVQAPATYNRPIVQKKLFKPAFLVRLELRYQGHIDLNVNMMAHVLNDSQYAKPGSWQPHVGPGQADLEGHLINRRLRVPSLFTAAQEEASFQDPSLQKMHSEDFEFTELNFVKSSRMSKRWLLFSCFIKDELIFVVYKLPTVVISRRTDQYSKAYESLMGQQPSQGIPKARSGPLSRAPSGGTPAAQMGASALQMLQQYRRAGPAGADYTMSEPDQPLRKKRTDAPLGEGQQQEPGAPEDRQIESWILQQYASTSLQRPLTRSDLLALETRARAGRKGPDLEPALWEDFKDWFVKTVRALKQCEEEWRHSNPPCICGFAMDRAAADAALQYQPVGAFLVRMCSEPGSFAISCRTSADTHPPHGGPQGHPYQPDGFAGVEHLLVDCVDLQRRELWQYVAAWGQATHLLDPFTQRLHLKNQVFFRQTNATASDGHSAVAAPLQPTLDPSQLLRLAQHHYQSQTHQPPSYPTPYPPDPTNPNLPDASRHGPASYMPSQLSPTAEAHGNQWATADAGGSGAGFDPRLGALLATLQNQLAVQNGQAGPAQLTPRNASFDDAVRQEPGSWPKQPQPQQSMTAQPSLHQQAQPHQQQQQLQRQSSQPKPQQQQHQQQQQQQQQQAYSAGMQQSAEGQGQMASNGPGWGPDPASMQALQAMLQQTRPQRSWALPEDPEAAREKEARHSFSR